MLKNLGKVSKNACSEGDVLTSMQISVLHLVLMFALYYCFNADSSGPLFEKVLVESAPKPW